MHRITHTALVAVGLVALSSCKDEKLESARQSERQVATHVQPAREGLARLTRDFVPVLEALAPRLATAVEANNESNVRFALLGLRTVQTPSGSLTGFPTGFVAAVRPDGTVIARNAPEPDDRMRNTPLAPAFASVRGALAGTAGQSVGVLPPAAPGGPARPLLVAAAPIRAADGRVVGALAAGIHYSQFAVALKQVIQLRAGSNPVLWVGLHYDNRVWPSDSDANVTAINLVPSPLIAQIPRDWESRLRAGNGQFAWSFVEGGARGWGATMADLPQLENTRIVIWRSEATTR